MSRCDLFHFTFQLSKPHGIIVLKIQHGSIFFTLMVMIVMMGEVEMTHWCLEIIVLSGSGSISNVLKLILILY